MIIIYQQKCPKYMQRKLWYLTFLHQYVPKKDLGYICCWTVCLHDPKCFLQGLNPEKRSETKTTWIKLTTLWWSSHQIDLMWMFPHQDNNSYNRTLLIYLGLPHTGHHYMWLSAPSIKWPHISRALKVLSSASNDKSRKGSFFELLSLDKSI